MRAVGAIEMTTLLDSQGDLKTFRNFQSQPAHRDFEAVDQMRRFISASGARKAQYAALMAEVVTFEAVPEPLEGLLHWIWGA